MRALLTIFMRKTIAILSASRTNLLQQVLSSIRANKLAGYDLVVSIDGPGHTETIALANRINFLNTSVVVQAEALGSTAHHEAMFDYLLSTGADNIICLEDDVLMSPDCTILADWYFDNKFCDAYAFLNLLAGPLPNPARPNALSAQSGLASIGFCTTAAVLRSLAPVRLSSIGWDHCINDHLCKNNLLSLYPYLSRCFHIGQFGVHYTPDIYAKEMSNTVWSDGTVDSGYYIDARL